MDTLDSILALLVWCSLGGIVYTYAGYPILVYVASRVFGTRAQTAPAIPGCAPSVDLLIVAHNEADVIEGRIRNATGLAYPKECLRVVVASDGSDDGTAEICERHAASILPLAFPSRRGKAATLNAAFEHLSADIVVLSDANTSMDAHAVANLARWFADPSVGVVCGRLILRDALTGSNADGVYWRYENFLKDCEGRLNALLGANGAIYAIRRELLTPVPANTIVDDFTIPLIARLESNCRVVFDPEAIAHEETAADIRGEFRRRARIGVGGFQSLNLFRHLLNPAHGWIAWTFFSHKVCRWIGPFLLLISLLGSAALVDTPLYQSLFAAQLMFYAVALAISLVPSVTVGSARVLRVIPMFVSMNAALLVGFCRWVRGQRTGTWNRTARSTAALSAPTTR